MFNLLLLMSIGILQIVLHKIDKVQDWLLTILILNPTLLIISLVLIYEYL